MPTDTPQLLAIGDLELDLGLREVRRGGERLDVPKLTFRLLETLAAAAPRVVTHEELLEEVWSGVVVGEETVKQRVKLLREALGDDSAAPRYVATVRGHGYRLVAPVRVLDPPVRALEPQDAPSRRSASTGLWIALAAALLAVAWLAVRSLDRGGATSVAPSRPVRLAVLPLQGDPADEVFALGLQSELIARLIDVDGLVVRSRESAARFADPALRREIADALAIDAVLDGQVFRTADRFRVDLTLADARDDRVLWSLQHDGAYTTEELFSIQTRIARAVASELLGGLERLQEPVRTRQPTAVLAAYEAYLQGNFDLRQLDYRSLRRAIVQYERALELDPEFALAWSGLAQAVAFSGTNYGWQRPIEAFPRALAASDRALALEPGLIGAQLLRSDVLFWRDWNHAAALERLAVIAAEHPRDDSVRPSRAYVLSTLGRHEEALAEIRRGVESAPGDPWMLSNLSWRLRDAGEFAEMQRVAQRILDEHPGLPDARAALAQALLYQDRFDEAIGIFRDLNYRTGLAQALALAGDRSAAREQLELIQREVASGAYVNPEAIAEIQIALGDLDGAFRSLDQAIADRQRAVLFIEQLPIFDPLREDERYPALLRRIRGEAAIEEG